MATKSKNLLLIVFLALSNVLSAQEWHDVTDMFINNASFQNGSGWVGNNFTIKDGYVYGSTSDWFDCYQVVTLPKGHYKLQCQGFERLGSLTSAWNDYASGTVNHNVVLTAGSFIAPVKCVFEESVNEEISGFWKSSTGEYYPTSLLSAKECFGRGMYENTLEFELEGKTQRMLGLYSMSRYTSSWYCFTNLRLLHEGDFIHPTALEVVGNKTLALAPTETEQLTVKVIPEDADFKDLYFITSDPEIATVDYNGFITAHGLGTCTISIVSADPDVTVSTTVTIQVVHPEGNPKDLLVNEVMNANAGLVLDPSFNYGSWIELYNPTDEKVLIKDLYISDDPDSLRKFRLPEGYGVIGAKKFKNIYFDHNGIWNMGEVMQVPFDLNYGGGTIYISDADGIILQQEYPEAIDLASYARTTDGGDTWGYSVDPTPGETNDRMEFATERAPEPIISHESGLYPDTDFDITFEPPYEGAEVVVTLDGSIPVKGNEYSYEVSDKMSFSLQGEFVNIRFRTYAPGKLPSEVVTRSYIPNKGFTLPIISITGDSEGLYSQDYGILYTGSSPNGRAGNGHSSPYNFNMDWDRPVHFDYINKEGEHVVSQEVNMSKCGGWSRSFMPHSFKLKANKHLFGKSTIDYPFFDGKPYVRNKTLQIRQGGNDNTCRIKDPALQQIIIRSGLNVDCQECEPVHVIINGRYQGILNMREPNNKHFAFSNYGLDTDNMDQFEMSPDSGYVQMEGTDEAFIRWYDLSADAASVDAYEEIKSLVDVDEFCNYMAIELFLCNNDWPRNNVKAFRDRDGGKFRFVIFDLDQTFNVEDTNVFTAFNNKKKWTFDTLHGVDAFGNDLEGKRITAEIKLVTIFNNMLKNDEFRKKFIDSFCIVAGSVFAPQKVKDIVTEMKNTLISARNKLNTQLREDSYDSSGFFDPTSSANQIISKLTSSRNNSMVSTSLKGYTALGLKSTLSKSMTLATNIPEAKVYMNDMEVPYSKFDGKYFPPMAFTTKAPAGYRFRGWVKTKDTSLSPDEYDYISTDSKYEIVGNATGVPIILTAIYEPIPADELVDSKTRPVMINEISPRNASYVSDYAKKSDWFELYNTTDHDIDIAGLYLSDDIETATKYQIPVGDESLNTIIPAHGYKVVWTDNKEHITSQLHANFKLDADGGILMITADPTVAHESLFNDSFSGLWTDSISYEAIDEGYTLGRYPDGAASTYLMTIQTIGKANQVGIYSSPYYLDPIETAIQALEVTSTPSVPSAIYTLDGVRTSQMRRGVNIVRYSDGSVKKVLKK